MVIPTTVTIQASVLVYWWRWFVVIPTTVAIQASVLVYWWRWFVVIPTAVAIQAIVCGDTDNSGDSGGGLW